MNVVFNPLHTAETHRGIDMCPRCNKQPKGTGRVTINSSTDGGRITLMEDLCSICTSYLKTFEEETGAFDNSPNKKKDEFEYDPAIKIPDTISYDYEGAK